MKALLLILIFLVQIVDQGLARSVRLPEVPEPRLSMEQALAIGQKAMGKDAARVMLVGVDWCVASQFRPRYVTGSVSVELQNDPGDYCWFITYIDRKTDPQASEHQKFREVTVVQIADDGTSRILRGMRK